jgi:predicted extracellular nuclease
LNVCTLDTQSGLYNIGTCPESSGSLSISLCFAGSETVQLASGETKMLSEVLVGDRVLAADSNGNTKFSEVVAVPHPANQQAVTFTHLQTEAGRDIKMTAEHLLPVSTSCSGSYSLAQASSVQVGSCVQTVTGAEKVSAISEVQGQGVYSVVTKEAMVVVNGIVASPFARNHAAAHAWYNIVRAVYSVAPAMFQNNWVKNANLLFGNVAASF